ncbi:hypothetical protein EV714DRAFT_277448 [Schizophyllum commune]
MIFAFDEALKTYKERATELEKEKAMLEINIKQERSSSSSSASAQAKAARKETASFRKDLSATRAELAKAKEHVVDFTDVWNGLRKAARDLAAAISERDVARRGVAALREAQMVVLFDVSRIGHEPCDGNLVERDVPLAEATEVRTSVAGLWDALGWIVHVREERETGAPSRMPLESTELLLAMSEGSSDAGFGIVCVAMKRVLEEVKSLVERYNTTREELERMQEECRKITRASGCGVEAMEEKESTPAALAEVIASEPATYGCTGATISTILGGAHLPNDILSVTSPRTEIQHLAGDGKALRATLDAARTAPAEEDVSLPATIHDVASAQAKTHAAREEVEVWKRVYVKWRVEIIDDYTFMSNAFISPSVKPSVAGDGAKRFGDPEHAGRYQSRARRD